MLGLEARVVQYVIYLTTKFVERLPQCVILSLFELLVLYLASTIHHPSSLISNAAASLHESVKFHDASLIRINETCFFPGERLVSSRKSVLLVLLRASIAELLP